MSDGILSPFIDGLFAVCITGGGWLVNGHRKRMEKLENDHDATQQDLADYKLDSEKRFAKEESMQFSLGRLHDRMDVISDDIKQILGKL